MQHGGGDPTSEAWGYAYAGVQATKDSSLLNDYAWYYNNPNTNNMTHEVGKLKPNTLDLFDMNGNVSEWCYDWYKSNITSYDTPYRQDGFVINPLGAIEIGSSYHVTRGGAYSEYCYDNITYHNGYRGQASTYGFRVCRTL